MLLVYRCLIINCNIFSNQFVVHRWVLIFNVLAQLTFSISYIIRIQDIARLVLVGGTTKNVLATQYLGSSEKI